MRNRKTDGSGRAFHASVIYKPDIYDPQKRTSLVFPATASHLPGLCFRSRKSRCVLHLGLLEDRNARCTWPPFPFSRPSINPHTKRMEAWCGSVSRLDWHDRGLKPTFLPLSYDKKRVIQRSPLPGTNRSLALCTLVPNPKLHALQFSHWTAISPE
ncbi:hypothetical protein DL98DRAFT_141922 [Cadophora sp. DSE1049]|nr:hypothetical protein DL98DRAFT_141922 [Cadophora sp. DSE1049]